MLGTDHPMEAHKVDSRMINELGKGVDVAEGVTSFLEKRPRVCRQALYRPPSFDPVVGRETLHMTARCSACVSFSVPDRAERNHSASVSTETPSSFEFAFVAASKRGRSSGLSSDCQGVRFDLSTVGLDRPQAGALA